MVRLKFGDSLVICQIAKLKSPPNKPRIQYYKYHHYYLPFFRDKFLMPHYIIQLVKPNSVKCVAYIHTINN